ncbi:MAG: UDP-N-acetylmuramoyl-L-alanine--D-glutamate ligase [bacterium]|nr:UDP-N-acetylmuramoyl-L-alanine--D-glutamate ligase [bacterium]
MDLNRLQRILVVGAGSSGLAGARLATNRGVAVSLSDSRSESELSLDLTTLPPSTRTFLGGHPEQSLDDIDLVLVSPGVAPTLGLIVAAQARGLPVLSELEYAWLHRPSAPLAAITGSNGKSTVTVLIAEMLRRSDIAVAAGGNLGPPASELVLTDEWDTWVLEVSSFQSELLTEMAPQVGVFLNLSQDHLERHPDLTSYETAKRRLFAFQTAAHLAVLNLDDRSSHDTPTRAQRREFSLKDPCDAWFDGSNLVLDNHPLIVREDLALAGLHNVANALAAALAAQALGAARSAIADTLRTFDGLDHRHKCIAIRDGVQWVDDSKATNVGATVAALAGYGMQKVHLILGGLTKGQDFSPLAAEVSRAAAQVYLIGIDRGQIAKALSDTAPIEDCGTLEEAIKKAQIAARAGDTVLLAPACASFDQFSGYAERGDRFAELAQAEEVAPCR